MVKGTKTCISSELHGLGSGLGARGRLSRWLGGARGIRGLICGVTTLLSALRLLGKVVGLSLDQVLALMDTVVRVLTERAQNRGGDTCRCFQTQIGQPQGQ